MNGTRRLVAVARRLGWGRNALRRPSDRIEIIVTLAAIAVVVAVVPLALSIGSTVYRHNLDVSAKQTTSRHQVTATLLESTGTTAEAESVMATVPATARWIGPDGSRHSGMIPAPRQAQVGTPVHIWTDAKGNAVDRPLSPEQAWERGALAVVVAMGFVIMTLSGLLGLVRLRLNKIRFAAWEAEWRLIDPWRTRNTG
jgi:hypothetical protein